MSSSRTFGERVTGALVALPRAWAGRRIRPSRERGSAVVDFVLVGGLLTILFMSVIQLMLVLHVRNTLIDAAGSGARYGTLADRSASDAKDRTGELISSALGSGFTTEINVEEADSGGIPTLQVTVIAPLPVVGLVGPGRAMEVTGHALLP